MITSIVLFFLLYSTSSYCKLTVHTTHGLTNLEIATLGLDVSKKTDYKYFDTIIDPYAVTEDQFYSWISVSGNRFHLTKKLTPQLINKRYYVGHTKDSRFDLIRIDYSYAPSTVHPLVWKRVLQYVNVQRDTYQSINAYLAKATKCTKEQRCALLYFTNDPSLKYSAPDSLDSRHEFLDKQSDRHFLDIIIAHTSNKPITTVQKPEIAQKHVITQKPEIAQKHVITQKPEIAQKHVITQKRSITQTEIEKTPSNTIGSDNSDTTITPDDLINIRRFSKVAHVLKKAIAELQEIL